MPASIKKKACIVKAGSGKPGGFDSESFAAADSNSARGTPND